MKQNNMNSRIVPLFLYLLVISFQSCYSDDPITSLIFNLTGSVYPTGYYYVTVTIEFDPYFLVVDTGSNVAWLQCDGPCVNCTRTAHELYMPKGNNYLGCMEPRCADVYWPLKPECQPTLDVCGYEVGDVERGSSRGVMVQDFVSFLSINGTYIANNITFGCGVDQKAPAKVNDTSFSDGVLGLGPGRSSISNQLNQAGLTSNTFGHCFSAKGGGYLFFGDEVIPSFSPINWLPMASDETGRYSLGTVDLYLDRVPSRQELPLVFDSGSTYIYFNEQSYKALLFTLQEELTGKDLYAANDDKTLPVCWASPRPFQSFDDVKDIFKSRMLSFRLPNTSQSFEFPLDPESYLIISEKGNVCLGILNGSAVGLPDVNLIGGISFQEKIIIYNHDQQIGWAPTNCSELPKYKD